MKSNKQLQGYILQFYRKLFLVVGKSISSIWSLFIRNVVAYWLLLQSDRYRTKRHMHALRSHPRVFWAHILVVIFPDSHTTVLRQIPPVTPSSESGEIWWKMRVNFANEIYISYSTEFFNMEPTADGFIPPPKEVTLRNVIGLKNPSSSAGF
jgi:hypothetical protein